MYLSHVVYQAIKVSYASPHLYISTSHQNMKKKEDINKGIYP